MTNSFVIKADTPDQFRHHLIRWMRGTAGSKRIEAGMARRKTREKECSIQAEVYEAVANFTETLSIEPLQVPAIDQSMPTYAIRVDHYTDDTTNWHAFTITQPGCKHTFFSGPKEMVEIHAAFLRRLPAMTIGLMIGDQSLRSKD